MPTSKPRSRRAAARPAPTLVAPEEMHGVVQGAIGALAFRAFELFERRGRVAGRDLEDWHRAESELLHPARVEIARRRAGLTLHAEVWGFRPSELLVCVEPHRVTIVGERRQTRRRTRGAMIYAERRGERVLRFVDLPIEVDATRATATFTEGALELALPLPASHG
jgi:HSP20 family molecular chaperone IbpA